MIPSAVKSALEALPETITKRSGSVFYTGRSAFEQPADLYILGLNPGGSPVAQAHETIAHDLAEWLDEKHRHWSAYHDESWAGRPQGTSGMQPRLIHMFQRLGLNLRNMPAANVVFIRSTNEASLAAEKAALLKACWPVHEAVLGALDIRSVLALGRTSGRWIRDALGAHVLIDEFEEANARGWRSEAHQAPDGRAVITVTHPGRADWRNPAADPSKMVHAVLKRKR
jgi:hypothetical protein